MILREEDDGGRVMVMRDDNECGQEADQRSGYEDKHKQVEQQRDDFFNTG